jgi:hypothetical protein
MEEMKLQVMAEKYLQIITQVEGMTLSWKTSQKLVGGKKRLERLMLEEKVRYDKPEGASNTKWLFNAVDIFTNIKPNPKVVKLI